MLFGISAKKQSGKDLFLKIWNALILTKKGDELTDSEIEELQKDILDKGAEYFGVGTYEKHYFARPLKEVCASIFGCSPEDFESEIFKETELPEEWAENLLGIKTYREALQFIGTELFRSQFHNDVWVIASTSRYREGMNWFFTDVRFPNEKAAIERLGGKVIRIDTTNVSNDEHMSEKALDDAEFEIRIKNEFYFAKYVRDIYSIMIDAGIFNAKK